jgi:hypothetical protein
MTLKEPPLEASIEEKIQWAELVWEAESASLLRNRETASMLERFRRAALASQREMRLSGAAEICRRCDQEEGGSCCGKGIEDHYSALLLLVNRLLGIPLPKSRPDPESCYFLAPDGCMLLARHVICVNYICRAVTERIDPARLSAMREKEGEELTTLFLLAERVRSALKAGGPP